MDKIAQKRRALTKLREMINVPTEALMGKFSPQFVELMDQLREIDDSIREHASELKNLLKLAKTNFNRREYMVAVSYIGQFHEKVEAIYNELSKLATAVDIKHHEFLFGDVDQENIDYLINKLGPKFDQRKLQRMLSKQPIKSRASIEKEAGLADWWYNLTTDRGRALAAWEKRFPKESKELKRQTDNMIKKSASLLDNLLSTLKTLASHRATRRLEEYLKESEKFKQKYKSYDATFSLFYDTYVKKFVEMQKEMMNKQEDPMLNTLPLPTIPDNKNLAPPMVPVAQSPEVLRQPERTEKTYVPPSDQAGKPLWPPHVQQSVLKQMREREEQKKALEALAPPTEHDVGSTLRSPLRPDTERSPFTDRSPLTGPATSPESYEELSHTPPGGTLISPTLDLLSKDKPIEVSLLEPQPKTPQTRKSQSHQEFLQHLSKLAEHPFVMATEMITYANSIKEEDPQVSKQLLELSRNILVKG